MKNIKILFLLFPILISKVFGQQDPSFSQYWVNPQIINPAQAGSDGKPYINLTGRYQWIDVKGSAKTHTISWNTMTNKKIGLGASYVLDQIGPSTTHNLNFDFAYYLRLNEKWHMAAGIRICAIVNQLNFTDFYTVTPGDPLFMQNENSGLRPNGGFGFLLSSKKLYFGYSQPRVVNYSFGSGDSKVNTNIISHHFAYAGMNQRINSEIQFRPSVLFKSVANAPIQFDFNTAFEIKEKLTFGLSYRTNDGIGAMVGLLNLSNLDIYYCYDYPLSAISMISKQTHQITLNLAMNKEARRINSPRYFN